MNMGRYRCLQQNRQNQFIYRYFWTYLIVLMIPLILCSVIFLRTISEIRDDDIAACAEELKHSAETVEVLMQEISSVGQMVVNNPQVSSFSRQANPFLYPNTYRIIELQSSLLDISDFNQYIFDYYIFYDKSKMVINDRLAYAYEDFYNLYFHEERYADYQEWIKANNSNSMQYGFSAADSYYYYSDRKPVRLLAYEQILFPHMISNRSRLVIFVKEEALSSLMPALPPNSAQFIRNSRGEVLYSESSMQEFNIEDIGLEQIDLLPDSDFICQSLKYQGIEYILMGYPAGASDLLCFTLQPALIVKEREIQFITFLGFILFLALLIGIVVCLGMARKSATPLSKLHMAVEAQRPLIQNALFTRLIYGGTITEEELENSAEFAQFPFRGRVFWAVIFCLDSEPQISDEQGIDLRELYVFSLLEFLDKIIQNGFSLRLDESRVLAVLSMEKTDMYDYREYTERIAQEVRKECSSMNLKNMEIYGGTVVTKLSELFLSFDSAAALQRYPSHQDNSNVIWNTENSNDIVNFPLSDIGKGLNHYVLTGNIQGTHDCLEEILKKHFIESNLSGYMQQVLVDELQIGLVRIMESIDKNEHEFQEMYKHLKDSRGAGVLERIRITQNLYLKICNAINMQRKQEDTLEIPVVVAYIEMNYGDSNLSLCSVADKFHVSEVYLSKTFKQVQGINFSCYLEKTRLDKAKELLKNSNMSVNQIAEYVGYTSTNSFCRAFKRVVGINAMEYRGK